MKDFLLGFFVCVSLSLSVYTLWENHRHVPVILQPIPIYVKPESGNITVPQPPAIAPKEILKPKYFAETKNETSRNLYIR